MTSPKNELAVSKVEPPLKPNQPIQRMITPSPTSGIECPGMTLGLPLASYLPLRAPSSSNAARAPTAPVRWTTEEPAKSITGLPPMSESRPVMDFAGSSVVHLTGAVGALAALLLLGARKGKYDASGKPRVIPGHSMPLVGLGVIILWIGWFGFNGGSTFETASSFFGEVMLNTQLAAAAGVIGASLAVYLKSKTLDVGMAGNGAIAGLVGITAPSGFVEYWAAPIIGFVAGLLVVFAVLAIDKLLDDPVGALSAHGLAGVWGTLSVGIFGSARLVSEGAAPGVWYSIFGSEPFSASIGQLAVQGLAVLFTFVVVFTISIITFGIIKSTIGLRVDDAEEEAGLDISSHGMYGYPEQFIPQPEYSTGLPSTMGSGAAVSVAALAQMTATESRQEA